MKSKPAEKDETSQGQGAITDHSGAAQQQAGSNSHAQPNLYLRVWHPFPSFQRQPRGLLGQRAYDVSLRSAGRSHLRCLASIASKHRIQVYYSIQAHLSLLILDILHNGSCF